MIMFGTKSLAQESFDLYGGFSSFNSGFRLSSFELNSENYPSKSDWEFSGIYGANFASKNQITNDVYLISLSKKLNKHYLYFRYSPGFNQEFLISSGKNISVDSASTILNTIINYSEKFGFGYAYEIKPEFSLGVSFRYFEEKMTEDVFNFFLGDTSYLTTTTLTTAKKFWRTDLGISYLPSENFRISLASKNLFLLNENGNLSNKDFQLRLSKGFIIGAEAKLQDNFSILTKWETGNSFLLSPQFRLKIFGGNLAAGLFITHDKNQDPFLNSLSPAVNFSSDLFSISLIYINYLRNQDQNSLKKFYKNGVSNIINNQFSEDRILLSLNLSLSFKHEKMAELFNLKITNDIFPTLDEEYVDNPIAIGLVKNLTDKKIFVRPAALIKAVNDEIIYSQPIEVFPKDTVRVKFYSLISESKIFDKRRIGTAEFFIFTDSESYDDKIEKPVLIQTMNSWDGKVSNLKYFVFKDFDFIIKYATEIYQKNSAVIDSNDRLKKFNMAKIFYNEFIKKMTYISDPRTSLEYVQFPKETILRSGGDCDDLSTAFSSMLEVMGIETAFVDYKEPDGVSHVNLLINTGLTADESLMLTNNDKKYYLRKNSNGIDEIWIPVETTNFISFDLAWEIAAEKFQTEAIENFGMQKGLVNIIDIF